MRVIAKTEKCIASGTCVMTCSRVFSQRDEDGVVRVLDEHPPLELLRKVQEAVNLCPAEVFAIEDENTTSDLTVVVE